MSGRHRAVDSQAHSGAGQPDRHVYQVSQSLLVDVLSYCLTGPWTIMPLHILRLRKLFHALQLPVEMGALYGSTFLQEAELEQLRSRRTIPVLLIYKAYIHCQ